jgi:hypothetical protein
VGVGLSAGRDKNTASRRRLLRSPAGGAARRRPFLPPLTRPPLPTPTPPKKTPGHPLTKSQYEALGWQAKLGRSTFPVSLISFPFYLIWGSPGRAHSHYHPHSDLFSKHQRPMVVTSDVCLAVVYASLAAAMIAFGVAPVVKLYWCALEGVRGRGGALRSGRVGATEVGRTKRVPARAPARSSLHPTPCRAPGRRGWCLCAGWTR